MNVLKSNLRISIQTLLDAGKAQREIAPVLEVDRKTIRRIDGGSIYPSPPAPSIGNVDVPSLLRSFIDGFGQSWLINSFLNSTTDQRTLDITSSCDPTGANIQGSAGLFTVDYNFGVSVVNNVAFASYANPNKSVLPAQGYLDSITPVGSHEFQLSFNSLFAGDSYTFNIEPTAVPLPPGLVLLVSGLFVVALAAWRGHRDEAKAWHHA